MFRNLTNAAVGNWQTTLAGFIAAVLFYLNQAGANLPTTKQEWMTLLVAAAIQWLGVVAKSANVGQRVL